MRLRQEGALTVREVEGVRGKWLAELESSGDTGVELDLTGLTSIDTAGAQLVLSLRRQCERQGRGFRMMPEAGVISECFERLGVRSWQ